MPEMEGLPGRVDRRVVHAAAAHALARLKRDGGNQTGTVVRDDGGGWLVHGRRVSDDEMLAYLTELADRWWSGEGVDPPPSMSAVLSRVGERIGGK